MKKTGKGVITPQMAAACYEQGKEVLKENVRLKDAVSYVNKTTGMSKGSAYIYISVYKTMREGKSIGHGISVDDARYYFDRIYKENGPKALLQATNAVQKYIDTLENPLTGMQSLLDEYRDLLSK